MGLRRKILYILLFIILMPPLTIGVQMFILLEADTPQSSLIAMRGVAEALPRALDSRDFGRFDALADGISLAVVLDEGTLLYLSPGATLDRLLGRDGAVAQDRHAFRFSHAGMEGTVYVAAPPLFPAFRRTVPLVPLSLGVILVVASLLAGLLLQGLSRSMQRLEAAMARIASGDLDYADPALTRGDLSPLGASLEAMRTQLKDDRERRDRFIMGVSHDLKTPLAVVRGYLDALADGLADQAENPPAKRADYVDIMKRNADLLGRRIAQLIELAKTTTGVWRGSLTEQDFHVFLETAFRGLEENCAVRGQPVELLLDLPAPCPLVFDPDMVSRVLENLLDNAVLYGEAAVPVRISAARTPDRRAIALRLENGGPGLDSGALQRVFEPFFRGDRGRAGGGFGLGLASVKSIVEAHGWTIAVQSEPGLRTAFVVTIPLKEAPPELPA